MNRTVDLKAADKHALGVLFWSLHELAKDGPFGAPLNESLTTALERYDAAAVGYLREGSTTDAMAFLDSWEGISEAMASVVPRLPQSFQLAWRQALERLIAARQEVTP